MSHGPPAREGVDALVAVLGLYAAARVAHQLGRLTVGQVVVRHILDGTERVPCGQT